MTKRRTFFFSPPEQEGPPSAEELYTFKELGQGIQTLNEVAASMFYCLRPCQGADGAQPHSHSVSPEETLTHQEMTDK